MEYFYLFCFRNNFYCQTNKSKSFWSKRSGTGKKNNIQNFKLIYPIKINIRPSISSFINQIIILI